MHRSFCRGLGIERDQAVYVINRRSCDQEYEKLLLILEFIRKFPPTVWNRSYRQCQNDGDQKRMPTKAIGKFSAKQINPGVCQTTPGTGKSTDGASHTQLRIA